MRIKIKNNKQNRAYFLDPEKVISICYDYEKKQCDILLEKGIGISVPIGSKGLEMLVQYEE